MSEESVSIPSIWASMISWFTPTVFFVLLNVMIGTIFVTSGLANQKQHQQPQEVQDDSQQPKLTRSPSVLQRLRSINLYGYRSQEPHPSHSITKQNPDSDTHFPLPRTHQQENLETQTQYVFLQSQEQQTLEETQTQFSYEQRMQETQTQYGFEQAHEEKTQKTDTQYNFEQTHIEATEELEETEELQTLDDVYSQLTDSHVSRTKSDTKPASGEVPARLPAKMRKSASLKSAFGHFEEEEIVEARRPATVKERSARVTEDDDEVDAKADDFINRFKQQLKLQRLDSILRYKDMIGRGSGKSPLFVVLKFLVKHCLALFIIVLHGWTFWSFGSAIMSVVMGNHGGWREIRNLPVHGSEEGEEKLQRIVFTLKPVDFSF
ncbi:unnamed protein product [Ilex paraguariensis]|uniref:DUF4408 domain-containing protein n=2 Tax=Ilex paraguariensis TaxID=185542 RepID=A0ABC8RID9_9AQUA